MGQWLQSRYSSVTSILAIDYLSWQTFRNWRRQIIKQLTKYCRHPAMTIRTLNPCLLFPNGTAGFSSYQAISPTTSYSTLPIWLQLHTKKVISQEHWINEWNNLRFIPWTNQPCWHPSNNNNNNQSWSGAWLRKWHKPDKYVIFPVRKFSGTYKYIRS